MTFLKSIFSKITFSKGGADQSMFSLDKTIKKLIYAIVFLVPIWFLPITVDAVGFSKQTLMVLFIVVTLMLWLIKVLNNGELRFKKNILNIIITVFVLIYILATIFSLRPYSSLVGWSTHLSGALINVLIFVALYFLIVNNFKGLKETFGLLFMFLISSGIVSLVGLLQIFNGFIFPWDFTKITSFNTIGTINALGIFSAVILILVTSLLFVVKRKDVKMFLLILGLLNLIILLSLNFWVLWVVLGIGMAVVLLFGLMRIVKLEENISWIALPVTILAFALIFILFNPILPFRPELPTEVGLSYNAGIKITKDTLMQKPILGTGPETFVFNYIKEKPAEINNTVFWNTRFSNPPAEILSIASDTGIAGLLAFLVIIVFFVIQAVKSLMRTIGEGENILKRFLEIGLFAGWFSLAVSWFLYPQNFALMFVFWLLLALYLAESSVLKEMKYNLRKSPTVLLITSFSFVVVIIIVVGFLYIQGTRFIADVQYKSGLDLIQTKGDLDNGINRVIKSTITNPYEDRTYRVLAQLFLIKLNRDANLEGLEQQEQLNLIQTDSINAINSAVKATSLSPKDISNWLVRGDTYNQLVGLVDGAVDWAEASYNEAIKIESLNPYIFTELGKINIKRANIAISEKNTELFDKSLELALENFNKAIEIKPDYAPAHFQSALVYDARGELEEAIRGMEINRQLAPNDTGVSFQLAVLYYKFERYDLAKAEFIRAIVLDPDFSNARYFLGVLYDRDGNTEDAFDQFERILKLNPDNEQIKQIISNLKDGKPALEVGPPKEPAETPIQDSPKDE